MNDKRLIETAFPLDEASAASLHEKNIRHGHISTLHLWPARRPLAASRAAIVAALLPDPGNDAERAQLVRRLGGRLVPKKKGRKENGEALEAEKVEAEGGILWWGHESDPDVAWFRKRIRAAYGGRAPRVLDPFAGGGAIPLEAMRLGCEVVANDLNPVAWFILKCTLEYPQLLGGQTHPLPTFALRDRAFCTAFFKARGLKGTRLARAVERMLAAGHGEALADGLLQDDRPWEHADFAWHVRAWGGRVLSEARRELATRYSTYAEWQALHPGAEVEPQPLRMLEPDPQGIVSVKALNADIPKAKLDDPRTPRWVAKPTVAYLWARTVPCKSCRATIPLLKTRWLCRKDGKRVLLEMTPNALRDGVEFAVRRDVPVATGSAAQRKAWDAETGRGTMSGTGVTCPCCSTINRSDDIRYCAVRGDLGAVMTAAVVDGPRKREYRDPQRHEIGSADVSMQDVEALFKKIPFGLPDDLIPLGGSRTGGGSPFTTPAYGLTRWFHLFTRRQLLALGTFVGAVQPISSKMSAEGYDPAWSEALWAYMSLSINRLADRSSSIAHWDIGRETVVNTFSGYRLPISWDFAESVPISDSTGSFAGQVEWIAKVIEHTIKACAHGSVPQIKCESAIKLDGEYDAIITDPPYYDAIPYSDIMDFFYVWLRRSLHRLSPEVDAAFAKPLGTKWDHEAGDGELIDDASRFGGDHDASKRNFEDGMAVVFRRCQTALRPNGILVVVFANKNPDAWETLVGAVIRAGFVVDGSLPIQTEMGNRTRAQSSAALSSSVWLICRKRPASAQPGWAGPVLEQMRANIAVQMRRFWDAGIRGPDFLWAATGPALEAFSRHPVVFRESAIGGKREPMPVSAFLRDARRLVVEFAVGRVLKADPDAEEDTAGLDDITTYYLLHRDTFGLIDAPVGACILYAISCGLSDQALIDQFEILARTGGTAAAEVADDTPDSDEADPEVDEPEAELSGTGSLVRLRRWDQRRRKTLGLEGVGGRPIPLIDRVHRLMQLWKAGDVTKVDGFINQAALGRDPLFAKVVQAVIELAGHEGRNDEAVMLQAISNHLHGRAGITPARQAELL